MRFGVMLLSCITLSTPAQAGEFKVETIDIQTINGWEITDTPEERDCVEYEVDIAKPKVSGANTELVAKINDRIDSMWPLETYEVGALLKKKPDEKTCEYFRHVEDVHGYGVHANDDRFLSIYRSRRIFDGAYPTGVTDSINVNIRTGQLFTLPDIIKPDKNEELKAYLRKAIFDYSPFPGESQGCVVNEEYGDLLTRSTMTINAKQKTVDLTFSEASGAFAHVDACLVEISLPQEFIADPDILAMMKEKVK